MVAGLRCCLPSEIVITDDGSTDDTAVEGEELVRNYDEVKCCCRTTPVLESREKAAVRLPKGNSFSYSTVTTSRPVQVSTAVAAVRIGRETPEMRHFPRELFLLARQCGAAGLATESRMLFNLARDASEHPQAADFHLYSIASRVLGWRVPGLLSQLVDRLR